LLDRFQLLGGRRRRQADALASPRQVDRREADEQRERRNDLEVDERLHTHAADLLEVGVPGDADHERREQERRDDRLDHAQEHQRQHAQVDRHRRQVVADLRADDHADEDPGRERAALEPPREQRRDEQPAAAEQDLARHGDRTELGCHDEHSDEAQRSEDVREASVRRC